MLSFPLQYLFECCAKPGFHMQPAPRSKASSCPRPQQGKACLDFWGAQVVGIGSAVVDELFSLSHMQGRKDVNSAAPQRSH